MEQKTGKRHEFGEFLCCHDCLLEGVIPQFEAAIEFELGRYPPKFGNVIVDIDQVAEWMPTDTIERFKRREQEYKTPPTEREYCSEFILQAEAPRKGEATSSIIALTDFQREDARQNGVELDECGGFLGRRSSIQESDGRQCYRCGGYSCSMCFKPLGVMSGEHSCEPEAVQHRDSEAFKGLTRSKDFQICPNPACSTKVELSAACNHVTCALCGTNFCFICGKHAEGSSGHWRIGGCPRYGHQDAPNPLFDGGEDDDGNMPEPVLREPQLWGVDNTWLDFEAEQPNESADLFTEMMMDDVAAIQDRGDLHLPDVMISLMRNLSDNIRAMFHTPERLPEDLGAHLEEFVVRDLTIRTEFREVEDFALIQQHAPRLLQAMNFYWEHREDYTQQLRNAVRLHEEEVARPEPVLQPPQPTFFDVHNAYHNAYRYIILMSRQTVLDMDMVQRREEGFQLIVSLRILLAQSLLDFYDLPGAGPERQASDLAHFRQLHTAIMSHLVELSAVVDLNQLRREDWMICHAINFYLRHVDHFLAHMRQHLPGFPAFLSPDGTAQSTQTFLHASGLELAQYGRRWDKNPTTYNALHRLRNWVAEALRDQLGRHDLEKIIETIRDRLAEESHRVVLDDYIEGLIIDDWEFAIENIEREFHPQRRHTMSRPLVQQLMPSMAAAWDYIDQHQNSFRDELDGRRREIKNHVLRLSLDGLIDLPVAALVEQGFLTNR
jgi:hypothetical protein